MKPASRLNPGERRSGGRISDSFLPLGPEPSTIDLSARPAAGLTTEPMFRPARQNKVFQDVVDQIEEAILSRQLKPGDVLPPERELKDMLQVSRGTLREAFRVLEEKGLLDIKLGTGGGAVIKGPSFEPVSESLARLIRHQKVSLTHLAEFREGVEGQVAALAARRATPEDIRELESLLQTTQDFARQGRKKSQEFLEADKDVHLKLAEISGNPIYQFVHLSVHDNIDRYYERYLTMDDREMVENCQDLKSIVQAVKEGRADEARRLARDHVHRFSSYMESSLSSNVQP